MTKPTKKQQECKCLCLACMICKKGKCKLNHVPEPFYDNVEPTPTSWEQRFTQEFGTNLWKEISGGYVSCNKEVEAFISQELGRQKKDYEILVNTILETKNKELEELKGGK